MRKIMIQIKQILINDEQISFDDIQIILNDSTYFIRLEGNKLCLNLFYENNSKQLININSQNQHENIEDRSSLGIFLGHIDISKDFLLNNQYRLKSSNEQKEIYQYLIERNS
ncbi:unnamed protein product [Rotaria sp. Silwood2]|nr:unnamed protein product [Rotaria sp. Silwood2]